MIRKIIPLLMVLSLIFAGISVIDGWTETKIRSVMIGNPIMQLIFRGKLMQAPISDIQFKLREDGLVGWETTQELTEILSPPVETDEPEESDNSRSYDRKGGF